MPSTFLNNNPKRNHYARRTICGFVAVALALNLVTPPSFAQMLPLPGASLGLTSGFQPPVLRGMTVHPENPLLFDFLIERGQVAIENSGFKDESTKLIKYFLASMTIPDKDAWVNLSPTEADRIIPDALGQTEMGRVMLEQDYLLKQMAASLTDPDTELGRKYWDEVNRRLSSEAQGGLTRSGLSLPVPNPELTKVWIIPDGATVVEKDGFAYITESKLKVLMEEDYQYLDSQRAVGIDAGAPATAQVDSVDSKEIASPSARNDTAEVFRELILPKLIDEVNTGKTFAPTRQVYQSVILASWYKRALKDSLLGKIYADKSKVAGIETDVKDIKQKVYEQYLEAFKKGVYNVIKEEESPDGELIPRKYFSGGQVMNFASTPLRVESDTRQITRVASAIEQAGDQLVIVTSAATETPDEAKVQAQQNELLKTADTTASNGVEFQAVPKLEAMLEADDFHKRLGDVAQFLMAEGVESHFYGSFEGQTTTVLPGQNVQAAPLNTGSVVKVFSREDRELRARERAISNDLDIHSHPAAATGNTVHNAPLPSDGDIRAWRMSENKFAMIVWGHFDFYASLFDVSKLKDYSEERAANIEETMRALYEQGAVRFFQLNPRDNSFMSWANEAVPGNLSLVPRKVNLERALRAHRDVLKSSQQISFAEVRRQAYIEEKSYNKAKAMNEEQLARDLASSLLSILLKDYKRGLNFSGSSDWHAKEILRANIWNAVAELRGTLRWLREDRKLAESLADEITRAEELIKSVPMVLVRDFGKDAAASAVLVPFFSHVTARARLIDQDETLKREFESYRTVAREFLDSGQDHFKKSAYPLLAKLASSIRFFFYQRDTGTPWSREAFVEDLIARYGKVDNQKIESLTFVDDLAGVLLEWSMLDDNQHFFGSKYTKAELWKEAAGRQDMDFATLQKIWFTPRNRAILDKILNQRIHGIHRPNPYYWISLLQAKSRDKDAARRLDRYRFEDDGLRHAVIFESQSGLSHIHQMDTGSIVPRTRGEVVSGYYFLEKRAQILEFLSVETQAEMLEERKFQELRSPTASSAVNKDVVNAFRAKVSVYIAERILDLHDAVNHPKSKMYSFSSKEQYKQKIADEYKRIYGQSDLSQDVQKRIDRFASFLLSLRGELRNDVLPRARQYYSEFSDLYDIAVIAGEFPSGEHLAAQAEMVAIAMSILRQQRQVERFLEEYGFKEFNDIDLQNHSKVASGLWFGKYWDALIKFVENVIADSQLTTITPTQARQIAQGVFTETPVDMLVRDSAAGLLLKIKNDQGLQGLIWEEQIRLTNILYDIVYEMSHRVSDVLQEEREGAIRQIVGAALDTDLIDYLAERDAGNTLDSDLMKLGFSKDRVASAFLQEILSPELQELAAQINASSAVNGRDISAIVTDVVRELLDNQQIVPQEGPGRVQFYKYVNENMAFRPVIEAILQAILIRSARLTTNSVSAEDLLRDVPSLSSELMKLMTSDNREFNALGTSQERLKYFLVNYLGYQPDRSRQSSGALLAPPGSIMFYAMTQVARLTAEGRAAGSGVTQISENYVGQLQRQVSEYLANDPDGKNVRLELSKITVEGPESAVVFEIARRLWAYAVVALTANQDLPGASSKALRVQDILPAVTIGNHPRPVEMSPEQRSNFVAAVADIANSQARQRILASVLSDDVLALAAQKRPNFYQSAATMKLRDGLSLTAEFRSRWNASNVEVARQVARQRGLLLGDDLAREYGILLESAARELKVQGGSQKSAGSTVLEIKGPAVDLPPVAAGSVTQRSSSSVGGIDFDPSKLNLQIKRDGRGVPLPLPQQDLQNIDIKGLYPVIINILPINAQTLPILGQLDVEPQAVLSKS